MSPTTTIQRFRQSYLRLAIIIALFLVMGLIFQRAGTLEPTAQALSSNVVISQVYGGGGNMGATLTNDFIELFNRGNTPVSLNGWAVQYASSAGTTWAVTSLTNVTLQPGQYYLIQEAAGTGGTTPLPLPDATGATAMSATTAKVALTSSTVPLSGTCPSGGTIVDLIGYGGASCFEGTATPALTNTTAALRGNAGCNETDNNSVDFATGAPDPRNTNDDFHICGGPSNPSGVGAANPNALPPGNSTLLTVNVTPGTGPTSTGITVTGNLSSIGGGVAQQFFDNATNGDVTAGDNIFSWQATVDGATSGGVKSLPISIADAELRMGSTNISLTVQAPSSPTVAGAANPSTVAQGASVTLTATVTPGLVPNSTGLAVAGDLTAIGGSATQQFFDDGTNGDAVIGNNVFTFQTTVPMATSTGSKNLPLTVTDAQARSGSGNISLTVTTPPAPHDPSEHMVMGNPSGAVADVGFPDNYLMMKLQYALSYNNTREIPNWTSWHLDSTWRAGAPRQDDFRNDTTLPPGFHQVLGPDYSGSGFDRGHMCPSADRTSSIPDNSATFLMTNMVPQAPGNNQGPWASMENYLRTFLPGSELYIVSGGTGVGGTGSGGGTTNVLASGVTVPQKTWKVVLILPVGDNDLSRVDASTRTIAVIMPNLDSIRPDQWQKYLATVDQVEALSGYDFFSNVDPSVQSPIELKPDAGNDTAPVTTGQTKSVAMDGSVNITLTATDFNVNNILTFTVVNGPQHGSLSGSGASLTYSPALHYFGPDSFTFKANDGALDSNVSTISINAAPSAAAATISGRITDESGVPVAGVTLRLSGGGSAIAITGADGLYTFRDVETNDIYTLTPTLANHHFNPASLSFSLLGNKSDALFTAVADGATAANPIDSNEYFVRQQYLDFLDREPDQAGFRYWAGQLAACAGDAECVRARRLDVSAAFFLEREFQDTGFSIYRAYKAAFGTRPLYAQFESDRHQLIGGSDLAAKRAAFLSAFVARAEFQQRYPASMSDNEFVDELCASVGADEATSGLLKQAMSSGATRAEVLGRVIELSTFAEREYNNAFVLTQYFGYLRRDPDQRGYDFWLDVLNSRNDTGSPNYRGMVCAFVTSAEYQRRFGSVVTRSNNECSR